MNFGPRTLIRSILIGSILLSTAGLGVSYAVTATAEPSDYPGIQSSSVGERDEITVISTDSNSWLGDGSDGPRSEAEVVAVAPNGTLLYSNTTHTRYWDVDPIENDTDSPTVEFFYSDHISESACPDFGSREYWRTNDYANSASYEEWKQYVDAHSDADACTVNGVARADLYNETTETVYSAFTPGKHSSRWHDGDRINDTHIAVADIFLDQVMIINTTSGQIDWQWNATSEYDRTGTGNSPYTDWTHVNDVDVLADGRLMASLRNQDSVVFLDPTVNSSAAMQTNQTLGSLDDYDTLYEQHNPDYIPEERGGPAVVVADSENNRIVEYQRTNGSWEESWSYTDANLLWPRDGDRLANGNTLIADSNGNRVFEVTPEGAVVWSVAVAYPYEAERFPVDGSGDGEAITMESATENAGAFEEPVLWMKERISGPVFQAIQYVMPAWVGLVEFGLLVIVVCSALLLALLEAFWRIRPRIVSAISNG